MPYKANEARRHKVPQACYTATNWPKYDRALQKRGSLTAWVTPEALAAWQPPRTGRRGRPCGHSDMATGTGRLLRLAFGRPWQQTEGLLRSITARLGTGVGVPDHTAFPRRSPGLALATALAHAQASGPMHVAVDATSLEVYGAGEWLVEKHGGRDTRTWRKLHLAVDPDTGEILASELTTSEDGDATQAGPLLGQVSGPLASVTADGAYDGEPACRAVAERRPDPPVAAAVPPRSTAVPGPAAGTAPALAFHRLRRRNLLGQLRPASATGTSERSGTRNAWRGRRRSATAGGHMRRRRCSATRPSSAAACASGPCRPRRPRPRSPARC